MKCVLILAVIALAVVVQAYRPVREQSDIAFFKKTNGTRPGFFSKVGGFKNVAKKPVLYLYHPKNNTKIHVELPIAKGDKMGTVYPAFNCKKKLAWDVVSNGDRVSIGSRRYSYLFWEKAINTTGHFKNGRVKFQHAFKGEDSERFMEQALTRFGFNEREKDDFITFWLPMLQSNAVNSVKFDTRARVRGEKKAIIKPAPKQHIYLFMYFKAAPKGSTSLWRKANRWQRTLKLHKKVVRKDGKFVAVEWGGVSL